MRDADLASAQPSGGVNIDNVNCTPSGSNDGSCPSGTDMNTCDTAVISIARGVRIGSVAAGGWMRSMPTVVAAASSRSL